MNIPRATLLPLTFALLFSVNAAKAEILNCGLMTVTFENGEPVRIVQEDGRVRTGASVSRNWKYNGNVLPLNKPE